MIFWVLFGISQGSYSKDYEENPEKYYRDPCPESRPTSLCNALDEYVWKVDENYKYEFYEENTEFEHVTAYTYLLYSQQQSLTYLSPTAKCVGQIL